ncbi:HMG (high mobility group) box protein [Rhizoctonia solani AG-3 Rhs1AP]|uniref:HMG (High mobility group) box protein n=2 Tax=Rhizoctonia solani AG-3 TaxID=1086053 RepID=A0A074RSG0_9AGAM|nr:HMG (high mobility group) box protein [Rhizoctonia solani AG-3 Rhs1AP]KEP49789.1 HMG (high mobility group) box protein [Rhizoctonia solani 123E]
MADHPGLSAKDGQALVDKLVEVSTNMRQAASLADVFAQSVAQLFPGTVIAPQPTTTVAGKKRGRVPKEGKRIKDPNAPKRPATSYIMFQNDIRDELRQKHPQLPYKELLGKVSEAWAVLGEDQKKAYQNVADSNMAKYNRAVVDYKGSLNGHAAAPSVSVAPTPEVDDEEEEEEEEEVPAPPAKKAKSAVRAPAPAPVPATESTDDSDAASSASEESDETPAAPPPPPVKASKPTSSKEKKKSKK